MQKQSFIHAAMSAPKFCKIALVCLLPLAVISLYAAEEAQPRVVHPGKLGGPPSDAIVPFDGTAASFRWAAMRYRCEIQVLDSYNNKT